MPPGHTARRRPACTVPFSRKLLSSSPPEAMSLLHTHTHTICKQTDEQHNAGSECQMPRQLDSPTSHTHTHTHPNAMRPSKAGPSSSPPPPRGMCRGCAGDDITQWGQWSPWAVPRPPTSPTALLPGSGTGASPPCRSPRGSAHCPRYPPAPEAAGGGAAPRTHAHTHTIVNKQRSTTPSQDVNSSSAGHQTRQSMFNASRRLSAVQGGRRRHILHPFMKAGRSLTGKRNKKKVFRNQFSQKSPRALHVLNHGWWRLAVGSWRLAVGNWWLVAVGGGWRRLVVVGGGWWLVIGGW